MGKIQVLLVDDEKDYVTALSERMTYDDFESGVAFSGEEALENLDRNTPDVMVLDLRMPGMGGMALLERVRRDYPGIQVIILTGHGGKMAEREARAKGAFEYLQKPVETPDLINTIRRAWEATKAFWKESQEEFERSMTGAALAEAGLPREAEAVTASPRPEEKKLPKGGLKVLLVDDEEDFVNILAERLELRDLGSDTALSGEEALSILKKDPPDVMVLDLNLPGMNGMAVLEQVKDKYPQIQVIILTGHGTPEGEAEARRLGAFDYLHKPVGIRDLMAAVYAAGQEVLPERSGDG